DVHAVRHPQRVEDDIHRSAVGQERHVLDGQHAAGHPLVAVAPRHLVARADLALLRDRDPHQLVDPRRQLVAPLAGKDLDLDHLALLAMGHAQRGVFDLTRLLPEDGAQQLLLGGEFGLALGGDLAHQNVAGSHLGADVDDAALVEVAQPLLPDVGNVAGDLLGTQLGVARLHLVLLDVDAGEEVLAHDALADQDGILEVAALPAHERHQDVLAQRQLAVLRRGAVGDRLALDYAIATVDDGTLVDAGALVRTHKLAQPIDMLDTLVV